MLPKKNLLKIGYYVILRFNPISIPSVPHPQDTPIQAHSEHSKRTAANAIVCIHCFHLFGSYRGVGREKIRKIAKQNLMGG